MGTFFDKNKQNNCLFFFFFFFGVLFFLLIDGNILNKSKKLNETDSMQHIFKCLFSFYFPQCRLLLSYILLIIELFEGTGSEKHVVGEHVECCFFISQSLYLSFSLALSLSLSCGNRAIRAYRK